MAQLNLDGKSPEQLLIERLIAHCPPEGYYFADGGGRCSSSVLWGLRESGCKFDAHHIQTGAEPRELIDFIREHHPETTIEHPPKHIWRVIEERGFPPTARIPYCCDCTKEQAGKGRTIVMGVRRQESASRANVPIFKGCSRYGRGKSYLNPIADWTIADVNQCHKEHGIPRCILYEQGFTRIGCVMCPKARPAKMQAEALRWPKFAKAWRRAFDRAVISARERTDKTCTQVDGAEMYEQWITGTWTQADESCDGFLTFWA